MYLVIRSKLLTILSSVTWSCLRMVTMSVPNNQPLEFFFSFKLSQFLAVAQNPNTEEACTA